MQQKIIKDTRAAKTILLVSITVFIYFSVLILISKQPSLPVIVGVFQELLTLPMLALELGLVIVCIILLVKRTSNRKMIITALLLLMATVAMQMIAS